MFFSLLLFHPWFSPWFPRRFAGNRSLLFGAVSHLDLRTLGLGSREGAALGLAQCHERRKVEVPGASGSFSGTPGDFLLVSKPAQGIRILRNT